METANAGRAGGFGRAAEAGGVGPEFSEPEPLSRTLSERLWPGHNGGGGTVVQCLQRLCERTFPPTPMLTLQHFDAASDNESARYRVLAGLAQARSAFQACRVSPHFGALVTLHRHLAALVAEAETVERRAGPVVDVDWESGRLVREGPPAPLALGLARWALPRVAEAISEGRAVFEFAVEHADLAPVGLMPHYRDEGFLIVADADAVRALRYRVSPLTVPGGTARALRTSPAEADLDPLAPPSEWKATLAASAPDLGAPAAFRLSADVDLPVDETLLPVAKRLLLGAVATWGEA